LPAKKTTDQRRRDLSKEALLFGALAAQLLLVVALIVHGPAPTASSNVVGVVGRFLAAVLYTGFGVVSFLLLAALIGAIVLARKDDGGAA